ncbi:hypothetical protein V500_03010 [Pseudogymnoascus sp. VKM F-4518 (FW-2643)]|nr:hypothetical protein V500_03010 [Pseudogymnoascus sp. VKM F-4518 (FW-2643)]
MPLSDGSKILICMVAEGAKNTFTAAELSLFVGFDKHGVLEPEPIGWSYKRKRLNRRETIYDSTGRLITIHGQVMRGSRYNDQKTPSGFTTERNFKLQPNANQWWSRKYHGLDTINRGEGRAYAAQWVKTMNPRALNHKEVVKAYDEAMLNEARSRVEKGTASSQKWLWVQRENGEASDVEDTTSNLESSSDDPSSNSDSDTTLVKPKGAVLTRPLTLRAAIEEDKLARKHRQKEREARECHDAKLTGMLKGDMEILATHMRYVSTTGQMFKSRAKRATYYAKLEADILEALRYVKIKFSIYSNDDYAEGSSPPPIMMGPATNKVNARLHGLWIGTMDLINGRLHHIVEVGQQVRLRAERESFYSELETDMRVTLQHIKKRFYIDRKDNTDDKEA